jgi:hypothetical protein
MKAVFVLWLLLVAGNVFSQKKFDKVITGKLNQEVFSTDAVLKQWFLKGYNAYGVNDTLIEQLRAFIADKQIVVVLGTWCSDSQREFPQLIKILETCHFPMKNLKVYGVSKNKTIPVKVVHRYRIKNVPSVIVFKNEVELGRIVEKAKVSLEYDLLHLD